MEIDESNFGKRKYHSGHHVEGAWVFGGFERGSGRIFIVVVENRSAETLLQCIERFIEKGTTIYISTDSVGFPRKKQAFRKQLKKVVSFFPHYIPPTNAEVTVLSKHSLHPGLLLPLRLK